MRSTTPQRLEQCRTAREAEALVWPVLDEAPADCTTCGQPVRSFIPVSTGRLTRLCPIGRPACSGQSLASSEASALRSAGLSETTPHVLASESGSAL